MSGLKNEYSVWMKSRPECVTLVDDEDLGCVRVEATDGFYLCNEADVDSLADEIKARVRRLSSVREQAEWVGMYL